MSCFGPISIDGGPMWVRIKCVFRLKCWSFKSKKLPFAPGPPSKVRVQNMTFPSCRRQFKATGDKNWDSKVHTDGVMKCQTYNNKNTKFDPYTCIVGVYHPGYLLVVPKWKFLKSSKHFQEESKSQQAFSSFVVHQT